MLGVHIAPDGNNKDQVKALRLKVETWVNNVRSSRANMEEVWTALHRTIPFSVCYPLPAVTLKPEECRYIMAPITKYGLPLTGIASTTPTAVKAGSIEMGGLGVIDPYVFMGTSQIENFVSNTWRKSPTGMLQEITLEDFALEMGVSTPWTTEKLQQGMVYATTHSWIRQVVEFTTSNAISIDYQLQHEIIPKREQDKTIMEAAFEYNTHISFLRSINNIRMLTKVICLSDLVTADGRRVEEKWLWPREHYPQRNLHQWPKTHHVNNIDWRRWREWLTSITRDHTKELLHPLGGWKCEQRGWVEEWDSVCTMDEELLYIRIAAGTGWTRHVIQPNQRRRYKRYYKEHIRCREPPEDPSILKRVSYKMTRTYIEVFSDCLPPIQWSRPQTKITMWDPYEITHNSVLSKIQEVLDPYFMDATRELNLLFRDFSQGTIVAVSDGSYLPDEKKAAAAWIIESACGTQWIMGSLIIPGSEDSYSSYRSELTGLVAISLTMKILAGGCAQPEHVIIGCDGKSALNSLSLTKDDLTANTSNYDLLSILVDLWDLCTMKPYPVHVKGHQDDDPASELSRLEKLNVLVDKLARLTAGGQTTRRSLFKLPGLGMKTVTKHGVPITGRLHSALYSGIVDNNLGRYFEDKLLLPFSTIDDIALPAFRHARSTSHLGMVKFMSKWWSNTLPTGVIMQRRRHRIFNRCPRCNAWGEDRLHLIVCWDGRAKIIRQWYLDTLHRLLLKISTHPEIIGFIMEGLSAFFRSPHQRDETRYVDQWKEEQRLLGWYNFVSGFIGKTLVEKQQRHFQNMGLRNKGKQWASKVITHNWHMIYKQWLGRNEVLHQKEIINTLSGGALLDIEVERVYDAGYADLPSMTHKWFRMPKNQLMEQSVEYKKGWLLIVRSIRESLNIAEYSIFSSSRALRTWVGLTKPK